MGGTPRRFSTHPSPERPQLLNRFPTTFKPRNNELNRLLTFATAVSYSSTNCQTWAGPISIGGNRVAGAGLSIVTQFYPT